MLIVWELDECGDKYWKNFGEGGATAGLDMARRRRKGSNWMSVRWTKLPVGVRATVKVLSVSKYEKWSLEFLLVQRDLP
jgi:hypothetical protein